MPIQSHDPVAAPTPSYVLPGPRRAASDVIVVPPSGAQGFERGGAVARALGERFLALAECQQQFLAELRQRLETLDAGIAENSRAQLKGGLRSVLEVLDWCDAVQVDFAAESGRAANGLEPVDLADICRLVAAEPTSHDGETKVTGVAALPWWADAARLAAAVRHGLQLVSERIGGNGFREIEIGEGDGGAWIRIAGYGEPGDGVEPATVQAFRAAATALPARVAPDALGPGAASLVLHLSRPE